MGTARTERDRGWWQLHIHDVCYRRAILLGEAETIRAEAFTQAAEHGISHADISYFSAVPEAEVAKIISEHQADPFR